MTIAAAAQSLTPGDKVNLYTLDLNPVGVQMILHFTNNVLEDGSPILFNQIEYAHVDVETSGWEQTGTGPFPRPKVKVGNVFDFLSGLLYAYNDLVGAKFIRLVTFRQFLDDGESPDPEAYFPPDIYTIEQKTAATKSYLEFTLSAAVDQQGITLPRRKIFRDTCTHSYRIPKQGGGFTYTKATCPYAGTACFDRHGNTTTPDKDQCGYRLSDCKLRFPSGALPTRAFPGVVRTNLR